MEKLLQKMARQLDSLDEASLMSLWSKYATQTSRFEPTRRWEEACLVFSLIQAKRWKNQLFNYCWSQQRKAPDGMADKLPPNPMAAGLEPEKRKAPEPLDRPCKILSFRPAGDAGNNTDDGQ